MEFFDELLSCDVFLDYFVDYSYESSHFMSNLMEAKKVLAIDFGLRICENVIYSGSSLTDGAPRLFVNGTEIPDPHNLSSQDLTTNIIELFEEKGNLRSLTSLSVSSEDRPTFGEGVLVS